MSSDRDSKETAIPGVLDPVSGNENPPGTPQEEDLFNLFLDLHCEMPRQGPGNRESTLRALHMAGPLPDEPLILDMGCGPGMQTRDLARATGGRVYGLDRFEKFLEELRASAAREGLLSSGEEPGVIPVRGDMSAPPFPMGHFDLIWGEGSIYILGFEKGLKTWLPFLKPGGRICVSEATWLIPDPPAEVRDFWDQGYPAMKDLSGNIETIQGLGLEFLGSFVLPDKAWWDHYYNPLLHRHGPFLIRHGDSPEARAVVAESKTEIDLFRNHSRAYGYVFYILSKPEGP